MHSDGSGSHVSVHSHSAYPEIVSVHGNDDDTIVAVEEDAPHLDDKEICHKVLCHCLIFLPPMMRTLTRL